MPRTLRTLEASAVLLFLLQGMRVLFSVLFGLAYDAVFAETMAFGALGLVMLAVVAAFLAPLVTPQRGHRAGMFTAALVAALARIPLTLNQPPVRLWSAVAIIGATGIYTALLLRHRSRTFPAPLLLALAADQLLRAAGNTYDVSLQESWLPAQAAIGIGVAVVSHLLRHRFQDEDPPREAGLDIVDGLAWGALLFVELSFLGSPNAVARWTGADYAVVAPLLMMVTLIASPSLQMGGTITLLTTVLVGTLTGQKLHEIVGLTLALISQFLLLLIPFNLAARRRERTRPALALGMLLFLILNVALALAFTYPYTIPALRDGGVYVFLAAIGIAFSPSLQSPPVKSRALSAKRKPAYLLSVAAVVLITTIFTRPPRFVPKESGPIRAGTYNIHYGYNTSWQFNLEAIARTIEESDADIVMLQEVDAGRITSYGVDDALWLARRLGMKRVYGPALEQLSGVALLSRFPITEAGTQHLTSQLEQTAIVHARVQVGERPLNAYGVWLGLEPKERARQLDDALAYVGDVTPAILGGDFNATPDSPTYARIQAAGFEDPFVVGDFDAAPTSPSVEPTERIDFVWERGLRVKDANVLDSLASDHRMVLVEMTLP